MMSLHCGLFGVPGCHDDNRMKDLFFVVLEKLNLHVRTSDNYFFYPYGITVTAILAESHAALHTWPEKGEVQFDIFFCFEIADDKLSNIANTITVTFNAASCVSAILDRRNFSVIYCP